MKKQIIAFTLIIVFIASFALIKYFKKSKDASIYTIGILQTASHPALDASRDGFIERLSQKLGDRVEFIIQNAQGNTAQAHTIAQQFHANKEINALFAIATPAAQALSAVEKQKPIIISAVTDPQALGLIYPQTNVTGVTDMIDVPGAIEMITSLLPQAKTVGLLYTSGETNSLVLADKMRTELTQRGLIALDFAVNNESDMQAMVNLACRKADVLLAPTDNTVAASIALITTLTQKNKTPLIVSDNMLVAFGALAARGVDYKKCGNQAADIAYKVLVNGEQPDNLAVEQSKSDTIYINEVTALDLGIVIPASLKSQVVLIA